MNKCVSNVFIYIAVDALWSSWGSWEKCSKTCSKGVRSRYRKCKDLFTIAPQSQRRQGDSSESKDCNLGSCSGIKN